MRTSLLFILAAIISANNLSAQNSSTFKKFGFKAGINLSNIDFNRGFPAPNTPIPMVWKTGFTAGIILHVPIATNLSVQPEYAYSKVLGEDKSSGISYSLDYLSLPVLLKYQLISKLTIEVGPQVDLLIDAHKELNSSKISITKDTEERNLGILGGVEIKVIKGLRLDARYILGLSHVGIRDISDTKEFKLERFELTTSINF
jgi:hypothetical protein